MQFAAGVVKIKPRKRAHMVDIVVHVADMIFVVADEVRENSGPAEAAVERLFRVGKAVPLRRRLAGFPVALETPRRARRGASSACAAWCRCATRRFAKPLVSGRGLIS